MPMILVFDFKSTVYSIWLSNLHYFSGSYGRLILVTLGMGGIWIK